MANTARLVIDPITRKISTKYEKIRLAKNDNNSMRITFEMPRYVRDHDMSNCSTIEVHYDNISIDRKQKHSDVYVVTDIIVAPEDDETINFSWLVSRGATQIVGNVDFSLHFGCNEDPDLEYAWHTTTYSGIVVLESKHNTQSVVEKHPDLVASILDYVDKKISEFDAVDIAQETGDSTEAVMSQKATTDALGGKVDKIVSNWKAYTTDGIGNTVPKALAANPSAGGVVLYNDGGIVKTNAPVEDNDAANKKFVEDGLAGKVDVPSKISGESILGFVKLDPDTGKALTKVFTQNATGTGAHLARFSRTTDAILWENKEPKLTIGGADPIYPIQYATKGYTDRKCQDLWDFVYGSFVETDTKGFYNNPVYIPYDQHLLPFASLDMISTGFRPKSGAYKDIVEDLAYDYNTADATVTNISTNTIKISTADYLNNPIGIEARLTESLLEGTRFMWRVSVVGGSYETSDESTLNAADGMTMQAVNKWLITNAGWEQPAIQFAIGVMNGSVKYNDLELKFEVMVEDYDAVDLVPIFAVEVGGETVYTIPQEIRDITYPVIGAGGDDAESNVYGLAINEGIYNYLDFDAKQYVINCAYSVDEDREMHIVGLESQVVIDVSAYLTDDDGLINISGGSDIFFVDEDGNSVGGVSPCQVTFLKDKGASIT